MVMLLNIGCGLDYRADSLNVDLHDLCVADVQGDAWRLPVADNSFTQIVANHLVEHLGYAGTIFALAEWHRVLKRGGTLTLETPERARTCAALAEKTPPAEAYHWAFGLANVGYSHQTLFGHRDLREAVERAGFLVESIALTGSSRTALHLRARRGCDVLSSLRARLHQGFVAAGIVEPDTAPAYLAHLEAICDTVVSLVQVQPSGDAQAVLTRAMSITARFDPRIASVTIHSLVAEGLAQSRDAALHIGVCLALEKVNLPARLSAALRSVASLPGTQAWRLQQVNRRLDLYLAARMHPQEAALEPAREWLDGAIIQPLPEDLEIELFCAETLCLAAQKATSLGQRAFARDDRRKALDYFKLAVAYDADNPLPWWNLGRLSASNGRTLEALEYYAGALENAPNLTSILRAEMDAVTGRNSGHDDSFEGPVGRPTGRQGPAPESRGEVLAM